MALVQLDAKDYCYGFWFIRGKGKDFLACVYKKEGVPDWEIVYRFRYYSDGNVWDSQDRKSGYKIVILEPDVAKLAEIIEESLISYIEFEFCSKAEFVLVDGNGLATVEALKKSSFAHFR